MNKTALQYGVFSGIVVIIYSLLLYIISLDIYTNWWLQMLGFVITIVFMIVGGIQLRKQNGGILSYRDSYLTVFIIALVSGLVSIVFNIILYNVINPDLAQTVQDIYIEKTVEMMENWGAPETSIQQSVDGMSQMVEQFKPLGQLWSFAKSLIFWAIISLLIALIPKKSPEGPAAEA